MFTTPNRSSASGSGDSRSAILVCRRYSDYDDTPGERYHFPRVNYEATIRAAYGQVVLIYEPRRGGSFRGSTSGGREAFIAWAVLGEVIPDSGDPLHAYVPYRMYEPLPREVPLSETAIAPKALQSAVLAIDNATLDQVLQLGNAPLLSANDADQGLVDIQIPAELRQHPIQMMVQNRLVRERTFRYNVIDRAYGGRCAFTGLALRNGKGRAEVDAAHIVPVDEGGPDVVPNGLAISKTLHWAFDRGLISIGDDATILKVERGIPDGVLRLFPENGKLLPPARAHQRPHPAFLAWHRTNRFKGNIDEPQ